MFNLPQKVVCSHSLKHLVRSFRGVASNRTAEISPGPYHSNADDPRKDSVRSSGYGEKEIFLLPTDSRTPLPGNTGLAPLSLLYKQEVVSTAKDRPGKINMECVAHECPLLLKKDFLALFPKIGLVQENLTVLTFCEKTENDMSQWNEEVEQERKRLEASFVKVAQAICNSLKDAGCWADFIHPTSGKPFSNPLASDKMLETDLRYRHFGFTIEDLGCCKVISHHLWGTHAFVGAIFTNAAMDSSEFNSVAKKYCGTS